MVAKQFRIFPVNVASDNLPSIIEAALYAIGDCARFFVSGLER